ncbi:MAG: hypothetical protein KDH96_11485 [Candidatus Riesia sp.]|nr:hypothetical protein [Candidatus Riesia sp.]
MESLHSNNIQMGRVYKAFFVSCQIENNVDLSDVVARLANPFPCLLEIARSPETGFLHFHGLFMNYNNLLWQDFKNMVEQAMGCTVYVTPKTDKTNGRSNVGTITQAAKYMTDKTRNEISEIQLFNPNEEFFRLLPKDVINELQSEYDTVNTIMNSIDDSKIPELLNRQWNFEFNRYFNVSMRILAGEVSRRSGVKAIWLYGPTGYCKTTFVEQLLGSYGIDYDVADIRSHIFNFGNLTGKPVLLLDEVKVEDVARYAVTDLNKIISGSVYETNAKFQSTRQVVANKLVIFISNDGPEEFDHYKCLNTSIGPFLRRCAFVYADEPWLTKEQYQEDIALYSLDDKDEWLFNERYANTNAHKYWRSVLGDNYLERLRNGEPIPREWEAGARPMERR